MYVGKCLTQPGKNDATREPRNGHDEERLRESTRVLHIK